MSRLAKAAANRQTRVRRQLRTLALLGALSALGATAGAQDAPAPLGRLFFTPEQRSALDRQRQVDVKETVAGESTLTIDGVALRSSGKRTVWVNGVAHNETPDAGVAIPDRRDPGRVVVRTTETAAIKAHVGDSVDRASDDTSALLGGGTIEIRRGAPAKASR